MPASYHTAVARMYALGHELAQAPSQKFDLAHMRVLLAALENPERRFPAVLIAGTNGKGSTAATLASILQASGLRTGLYTSPHLVRINERIQTNGQQISDDKFTLLHDLVERTAEWLVEDGELPWHPSFFEMLTGIAFEYFATSKVDIAVLEVGMGGRLDATNVAEPLVSVITDISLDHQKFLGNTIAEIAREKVGIIRPNGVVVTLPQSPPANDIIGNAILEREARAISAVSYVPPVSPKAEGYVQKSLTAEDPEADGCAEQGSVGLIARYPLQVMGKQILVETPLLGRHQLRNVALAIATAEELSNQGFAITPESIQRGIRETRWPGRFQVIRPSQSSPEFVMDVAHNPAGAWALRSTLSTCYEDRRIIFVFGAMRDKAISEIAEILFPLAERIIVTRADNPRSASPEEIRDAAVRAQAEIELAADVVSAVERAREVAFSGELVADGVSRASLGGQPGAAVSTCAVVVITGSIYVVGEAMRALGAGGDGE
ncbi:MAG: bifunctional folylpolyglutamate synthase/dihydrofolate synthase [Acidobacteria bacterium]|nr:MAG: bifunctional folylpolyglutamate synthase/dihydrofolate synthase [Acidobacteriota bacterium]PYV72491.1 MAG: bifunctional folylpolyglutamate synthase/dihydrofolate synthase [Acidobacteriota bacterium]PYV79808.1 MAG: bifunctional folylpolyglutamate synthase/dihydrofolate synthase [Acidobacteriota bacterium]